MHTQPTSSLASLASLASPAADRVRLALVTNVRLFRDGLWAALARDQSLILVAAAASLDDALAIVADTPLDIVAVDMGTPQALEIVRRIVARAPTVRTVTFGVTECERDVLACVEAGAAGYVPCEATVEELGATVLSVARGEFQCSPRIAAFLVRRLAALATRGADPGNGSTGDSLTDREWQIFTLLDDGLSNKEIARRLHIEVATVKNHVHRILDKLHVSSRGEAVARLRGHPSRWKAGARFSI